MIRTLRPFLLFGISLLFAIGCAESSREEATGDARIVGVNAIVDSPDLTFRIEERSLGSAPFGGATPSSRWDDLSYNFNFDASIPGRSSTTRVSTEFLDVVRDRSYLFVLRGSITNPEIILFDEEERQWDDSETVFEMTFAHMNNTTGPVDVYFAPPGTPPAAGTEAATLSQGERSPAVEYPEGEYVVTLTIAGDPLDIVFTSNPRTYNAATTDTIFLFDQDPSRTDNLVVRLITADGATAQLADPRFPPRARLVHAAADIGNVDVFENNDFASPLLTNQVFGDIADDIALTAGNNDYTWTDSGNTGAVVIESAQAITAGLRTMLILVGPASDPDVLNAVNIRRPYSTSGRIRFINAAANYADVDFYLLPAGQSIAGSSPTSPAIPFKSVVALTPVATNDFELTVTVQGEETVLAGPVAVDIANRDVIDVIVLDTADPNVADVRVIRNSPQG